MKDENMQNRTHSASIHNKSLINTHDDTPSETRWWIAGNLEHAVMHPVRHKFQLKELMQQQTKG
jgi:Zn-dependent peptidase ImmA (M78 family)